MLHTHRVRRVFAHAQRRHFWFQKKADSESGLVGVPGLWKPDDFPRLANDAIARSKKVFKDEQWRTGRARDALDTTQTVDSISNDLCRVADAAELIRSVSRDQRYVMKATEAIESISSYMGEVNLNQNIYKCLVSAEKSGKGKLNQEQDEVLTNFRQSMEHEGVHLNDSQKEELLELMSREMYLSFEIIQRRSSGKGGHDLWVKESKMLSVGDAVLNRMHRRLNNDGSVDVQVILDSTVSEAVLKRCDDELVRRQVYERSQVEDEGLHMMIELLEVRQRLALMRGYKNYLHYAQREAILRKKGETAVMDFLVASWKALAPGLAKEFEQIRKMKQELSPGSELQPWDVAYFVHKEKSAYGLAKSWEEYVNITSLLQGVQIIVDELLGLQFVDMEPEKGETWHSDVWKFGIFSKTDIEKKHPLGIMYLDPFYREGKAVQSAQYTIRCAKLLSESMRQQPCTALVCMLPPSPTAPLSPNQAATFMHEIGHAFHSLLSQTEFHHMSGTRGSVDFVEFPSVFFENFVWDPQYVQLYAKHNKTGEPMPKEVADAMKAKNSTFAHIDVAQTLMWSLVDQAFFGTTDTTVEGVQREIEAATQRLLAATPELPSTAIQLLGLPALSRFDHLVHYGGTYYCYLSCRALRDHVWERSLGNGKFDPKFGQRLIGFFGRGSTTQSLESILSLIKQDTVKEVPLEAMIKNLR